MYNRYRVTMEVEDETGKTTLVMFDNQAQKIFKVKADDYMKNENVDGHKSPLYFKDICNREFVFKVKPDVNNLARGNSSYTISRIFKKPEFIVQEQTLKYETKVGFLF